jgi:signal transduction histidine kinase
MAVPELLHLPLAGIVSRLEQHRTLGGAPHDELEWLASHGEMYRVERGTLLTVNGEVHPFVRAGFESLIVVFSGRLGIYVDHGAGPHKVMEWIGGDVTGYLPYSRMSGPLIGEMIVEDALDQLFINRVHFAEMIRECPAVTAKLVHFMVDRARQFRASELQDEKMKSLGKLAAGLAHELNNPASASARSARVLADALAEEKAAARALAGAGLSDAQLAIIDSAREACDAAPIATLTAIERADREDVFADWLKAHAADTRPAIVLADTALTIETLEVLADTLKPAALDAAVRWMAGGRSTRALASDIEHAAVSISKLVDTVKRFTYMDRALVPEAVDIPSGVNDSVALLQHKAREKSIAVDVQFASDLPRARAIGGDLNQVWINLIDNALDAAPESGRVAVFAHRVLDRVVVGIVDNGPGIAPGIRDRIFDPFFTSKPVGQGTGLGLDIARQLVRRNDGDIEVDSTPGRTEFRVTLHIYAAEQSHERLAPR